MLALDPRQTHVLMYDTFLSIIKEWNFHNSECLRGIRRGSRHHIIKSRYSVRAIRRKGIKSLIKIGKKYVSLQMSACKWMKMKNGIQRDEYAAPWFRGKLIIFVRGLYMSYGDSIRRKNFKYVCLRTLNTLSECQNFSSCVRLQVSYLHSELSVHGFTFSARIFISFTAIFPVISFCCLIKRTAILFFQWQNYTVPVDLCRYYYYRIYVLSTLRSYLSSSFDVYFIFLCRSAYRLHWLYSGGCGGGISFFSAFIFQFNK